MQMQTKELYRADFHILWLHVIMDSTHHKTLALA